MAPFCHLLSSKEPFEWTPALEAAFKNSKAEIIKAIERGVEIFDPLLLTCLRTDWSKESLGYHLLQIRATAKASCPCAALMAGASHWQG